jgi:hypothetical protein
MKTNLIRALALSALAATACLAQQIDAAQPNARAAAAAPILGVWDVNVTVVDCNTGALIRNVHSVQMYQPDGTFSETTNSGLRGSSIGYWFRQEQQVYGANYFFFRYAADGSFVSYAKAANAITLSSDSSRFTVTATIKDYDVNNNLISTGCVTQTASRL